MAIDNDGITIKVKVEYDPVEGDPINTRWEIVQAEDVEVPAYISGLLRDNDTLPAKFFDCTGKHPRFIMERRSKMQKMETTRVKKYSRSAFYRMIDAFDLAVPHLTEEHLAILTDFNQTKKELGISLPFLIEVNTSLPLEEAFRVQTYYAHKNRYWKKPVAINGKQYWITNHIFDHNIPRIKNLLSKMVNIEFLPDESEQEENEKAAITTIMNLIIEGKLPASVLSGLNQENMQTDESTNQSDTSRINSYQTSSYQSNSYHINDGQINNKPINTDKVDDDKLSIESNDDDIDDSEIIID